MLIIYSLLKFFFTYLSFLFGDICFQRTKLLATDVSGWFIKFFYLSFFCMLKCSLSDSLLKFKRYFAVNSVLLYSAKC